MIRVPFCLLIWTLLSPNVALLGQKHTGKKIVVIDPGHGGTDSGAVGVNRIREKEVVLRIAMEVLRLNKILYNDTLNIYSTRYADTLISLDHRTTLAKALKTDAFVSVHCNQAERIQAQGIEVYVSRFSSPDSEHLASLFADALNQKLGFKNRGVKLADFQVFKDTTGYPRILLELGFLSNTEEAEHLGKSSSISSYAVLILETLLHFFYHD